MENIDRIKIAYKKLKSTIFYDKTQLPLRDELVLFEADIEKKLAKLCEALFEEKGWAEKETEILESVGVWAFPKSIKPVENDTAIFNSDSIAIELEKPQYFINLAPEGHILGVLWVLEFGSLLDKNAEDCQHPINGMYPHSYGNRLKNNLINPKTNTYTYAPSLFEPYFSQYENWRDKALDYAKERLNDKQDALILTLDFKSFYYSVDIQQSLFDRFADLIEHCEPWQKRLNSIVFSIIQRYSEKLRNVNNESGEISLGNRNVLPIGFLPSNILSNVVLSPFDKAIIERWNPVYYGRYVDDIIIVDKVETNSEIYRLARSDDQNKRLNSSAIMKIFLCDTKIMYNNGNEFHVSGNILSCGNSDITVQDKKVKLFYFQSGSTKALLTCFQSGILENVSEFRYLPDMDAVMLHKDYSELFMLDNKESVNKLRSVTGISLNKFAMSKFLGKYRKVGEMIQSKEEDAFARDAMMIFDERVLIDNYSAWERLLEIFVINRRFDIVEKLAIRIISAINRFTVNTEICKNPALAHTALMLTLHSALCRTLSLTWGENINQLIEHIHNEIKERQYSFLNDNYLFAVDITVLFSKEHINKTRIAYCKTRMVNKYVMPVPIDCLLDAFPFSDEKELNMCSMTEIIQYISRKWNLTHNHHYCYYPYMFLPQDISFAMNFEEISSGKALPQPDILVEQVKRSFIRLNFPNSQDSEHSFNLENISAKQIMEPASIGDKKRQYFATCIEGNREKKHTKLKIAIGNARLKESNVIAALDLKPERSYARYSEMRKLIDEAISNGVDMLVLPECYLPFEWIPSLSRVCAKNQLALITGVEHIPIPENSIGDSIRKVYNLTAVILPYTRDDYRFAHVAFHNKVEYSPHEVELIEGYRYEPHKGNSYQLFCWKDVWFPVYCCYELTSIRDRAVFQTYADLVIAVEWNRDVHYFGNIVESLVRDMHCYCVQVNSSEYGDSRVMQPAETYNTDIIKTKGGKNTAILYDEIDIKKLRDFQIMSIAMQGKDKSFKQTPPDLDQSILEKKRNGVLKVFIMDKE